MTDDRTTAHRKWSALRNMTTARGCSPDEAASAARLADALGKRWGFASHPATESRWTATAYQSQAAWTAAYEQTAHTWGWEYRKCGKRNCHCVNDQGHGPYRYRKQRTGKTVRSIYMGK
jgi:hypothetical protein